MDYEKTRADRWWWPFGERQRPLLCGVTLTSSRHVHQCEEEADHGPRHECRCGFRWMASAPVTREEELAELEATLKAERQARENFTLGLLRTRPKVDS